MRLPEPTAADLEAMQAVAAARRDAQHVPPDWLGQLGAIARELLGLSGSAPMRLPEGGIGLSGRRGFKQAPSGAVAGNDPHRKFFVHLEGCADFVIDGLALSRGRNAVFLHRCRRFRIANADLSDLEGYGVVLFDCSEFEVEGVRSCNLSHGNAIRRNLVAPAPSAVIRAIRARPT